MSKTSTLLKVLLLHGLLLAILVLIPTLKSCKLFPKEEEVITIDLSGMDPPPPEPEVEEVTEAEPEEEEEMVIPEATPVPVPTPTPPPRPAATATPVPAPTATPRPAPTPTPRPPLLTPDQIRQRIENQQPAPPQPVPPPAPPPALTPDEIRRLIGQGLPSGGGGGGTGGGTAGNSAVSMASVEAELYKRLHSAWDQPRHLGAMSGRKVVASVDVQRDGTLRNSRIINRSGNAEFDQSVQNALSSVPFAKPLPSSYSGTTHTVEIEFTLTP